jgi:hypothetical protein
MIVSVLLMRVVVVKLMRSIGKGKGVGGET